MDSKSYNIVLLPTDEIIKRACSLSEYFEIFNSRFTLNSFNYFAHVSLYMVQLKTVDIPYVTDRLRGIATSTDIVDLRAAEYRQANGYIDAEYERTRIVDELQMRVIDDVNFVRDGLRADDRARLETAKGLELANIQQYGYRSVGDLFVPHLTFTRFIETDVIDVSDLPDICEFNDNFVKLALFEMGENGTCVRLVTEYNLNERD